MSLISLGFLTMIGISALLYYLLPGRMQWKILLLASCLFYCTFGFRTIGYIIVTSITVFFAARRLETMERGKQRKRLLQLTLLLNIGLLAFVKYTNFLTQNLDSLLNKVNAPFTIPGMHILLPIGISFYTFQSVGYLLDVYWKKDKAQQNFFRFALFVSFFPQIIQGPISKHRELAPQFEKIHTFQMRNLKFGCQLMLWGYFKKLVIADTIGIAANTVLFHPADYTGLTVIAGILAYCVQLYCDFSGGIDVIRGCALIFDIDLIDNFKRPFFSQSIAEFWRRWHITLGIWMKDYVFYPMALSKKMNRLGKRCQKIFGKTIGRKLPICLENIIIFFLVGVWHGASWHFIIYGLYNGFIIAISSLLEPVYQSLYKLTRINPKSFIMRIYRTLLTFILVNIGWYFDNVRSLKDSLILIKNTFLPNNTFYDGVTYLGLFKYQYLYVAFGCLLLFIVSILQERGIKIREQIDRLPMPVKWCIWLALIFVIPLMGLDPKSSGGFMYANF